MPNAHNILAPACLVGSGRSGTTLVTALLRRHPQVQALGETANLVFSTLYHIEKSLPLCGPVYDADAALPASVDQVRRMLISLFPSDAPRWFHKPIMLPTVRRLFKEDELFNQWFWDAGDRLFPDARWFTLVRDWRDVARSSMRRWNWTADAAIKSQIRLYDMLLHPASRVGLVIDFAMLVKKPERSTRRLLRFLGLPYDKACLGALDQAHAPNRWGEALDTVYDLQQRRYTHPKDETGALTSLMLDDLQERLLERARQDAENGKRKALTLHVDPPT